MAFRQAGAPAQSLIVGNPPSQLRIDANGIDLALDNVNPPAPAQRINWYDPAGVDPDSSLYITELGGSRTLSMNNIERAWITAASAVEIVADQAGPQEAVVAAALDTVLLRADDVRIDGSSVTFGDPVFNPRPTMNGPIAGGLWGYGYYNGNMAPAVNSAQFAGVTPVAPLRAGRLYRLTWQLTAVVSVAGDGFDIMLDSNAAADVSTRFLHRPGHTGSMTINPTFLIVGNGEIGFAIRYGRRSGGGLMSIFNATLPGNTTIEDIGRWPA